jgi:anti-anti-sigma regulatory factor
VGPKGWGAGVTLCGYVGLVERAKRHVGKLAEPYGIGPGAHVCCVVGSSDQLDAWASQCLREGAQAGQKLFRMASQPQSLPPDQDGKVTIIDPAGFSPNGAQALPVENILAVYRREADKAREEGFSGMRIVADMRWTLAYPSLRSQLAAFELRLDEVVAELGATVVCVYGEGDHSHRDLAKMVAVHPLVSGVPVADPGFRIWNLDRGIWEVAGEIDESNVELFQHALAATLASGPIRRVCCGGLRFVSAAGIRALSGVSQAQPGQAIVIQDASPLVRRCWAIFELDRHLPQVRFESVAALSKEVAE